MVVQKGRCGGKLGLGEDAGRFKNASSTVHFVSFFHRASESGFCICRLLFTDGSLYVGLWRSWQLGLGGRTSCSPQHGTFTGGTYHWWPVRLKVQKVISIPKNLVERVPYNLSQSNGRHVHFGTCHKGVYRI